MDERIKKELSREKMTLFTESFLKKCKNLVKLSRSEMSKMYDSWDANHDIYRGYRVLDKSDKKAQERGEPVKMVVPMTYAQCNTFVAFGYALFTQKPTFFELQGVGGEDQNAALLAEAVLQRDLEYSVFPARLNQWLTDMARFGMCIEKELWFKETRIVNETVQKNKSFLGVQFGTTSVTTEMEKTIFEGNKVVNVSPYRFFPDPRVPLGRLQEGEFVASEDEMTYSFLKSMESSGLVAGIQHVKKISQTAWDEERKSSRLRFAKAVPQNNGNALMLSESDSVIVTEVQVRIVPNEFTLEDGKPLSNSTRPECWLVWYANDQRVIRLEKLDYPHGQFTYSVGEFSADMHELVNPGICQLLDPLQSVVTWLINSHITSVRKVIENRLIVDTSAVEYQDLKDRNPIIRLKPAYKGRDVRQFIHQLGVQDVTAAFMTDANALMSLGQVVTGISENLLGQFASGRRSAREAGIVNSAAASRIKMVMSLMFHTMLRPMVSRMIENSRNGLTEETLIKLVGRSAQLFGVSGYKLTSGALNGVYDIKPVDMTMPGERDYRAQQLQEVLTAMLSNPASAQIFGLDPSKVFREIMVNRGIHDLQEMAPSQLAGPVPGQTQVVPDDALRSMLSQGQVEPL